MRARNTVPSWIYLLQFFEKVPAHTPRLTEEVECEGNKPFGYGHMQLLYDWLFPPILFCKQASVSFVNHEKNHRHQGNL